MIRIFTKTKKTVPIHTYDKLMMKYSKVCKERDELKTTLEDAVKLYNIAAIEKDKRRDDVEELQEENDRLEQENMSLRAQIREARDFLKREMEGK